MAADATKRVLFLDDDMRRTDEFRYRMRSAKCELVTVTTSLECIERLGERGYDLVLLDHDLGGETFVDSDREDCGMEVVRWLKANRGAHGVFVVHSMNAVAAASMYFELSGAGYAVHQAVFGSPEFFAHVHAVLGVERSRRANERKGPLARLRAYLRGLRGGR